MVLGAFIAILGYAVVYNGLSNLLSPSTAFPGPLSVIGGLTFKPVTPSAADVGKAAKAGGAAAGKAVASTTNASPGPKPKPLHKPKHHLPPVGAPV